MTTFESSFFRFLHDRDPPGRVYESDPPHEEKYAPEVETYLPRAGHSNRERHDSVPACEEQRG